MGTFVYWSSLVFIYEAQKGMSVGLRDLDVGNDEFVQIDCRKHILIQTHTDVIDNNQKQ